MTVLYVALFGYLLIVFWRGARQVEARLPREIIERLRAHPESAIDFDAVRGLTWNPSKPIGPRNWINGPGNASYRLEGDLIQLRWTPRGGHERHYVGPVPTLSEELPGATRQSRKILVLLTVIYVATLGIWWLLSHLGN